MTYRSKAQHRREDEIQHHGITEKTTTKRTTKATGSGGFGGGQRAERRLRWWWRWRWCGDDDSGGEEQGSISPSVRPYPWGTLQAANRSWAKVLASTTPHLRTPDPPPPSLRSTTPTPDQAAGGQGDFFGWSGCEMGGTLALFFFEVGWWRGGEGRAGWGGGVRFVRMPCSVRAVFRRRLVWLVIICRRRLGERVPARGRPQACSCSDYMSIKHLLKRGAAAAAAGRGDGDWSKARQQHPERRRMRKSGGRGVIKG